MRRAPSLHPGVGLSALMPPWAHTLSAQQIEAVIRYLRTLRKAPSPP